MSLKDRMIRILGISSILISPQAVPAFAEKITLACSYGGEYVTLYYTFDLAAKTVVDHAAVGDYAIRKDTYKIVITENDIFWRINAYKGFSPHTIGSARSYNLLLVRGLTIHSPSIQSTTRPAIISRTSGKPRCFLDKFRRAGRYWHFAAFAATHHFVAYWSNNGHLLILARDGSVAFDPTATL